MKSLIQVNKRFKELGNEDIWEHYAHQWGKNKQNFIKLDTWYNSIRRMKAGRWVNLTISGTFYKTKITTKYGQIKIRPWWTPKMLRNLSKFLHNMISYLEQINFVKWEKFYIITDKNSGPPPHNFDINYYTILSKSEFSSFSTNLTLDSIYNETNKCLYQEIDTLILGGYNSIWHHKLFVNKFHIFEENTW